MGKERLQRGFQYPSTARRGGKPSPYHKYGKRPSQLSEAYRTWKGAVERHGLSSPQARAAGAAHRAYVERQSGPLPGFNRHRRRAHA